MIRIVAVQTETLPARPGQLRMRRWLVLSAGVLIIAFALALFASRQSADAPVTVRLAGWTNSTGLARVPLFELINVSGRKVYPYPHCQIQAEGALPRVIDLKAHSPSLREIGAGESALVEVPLPPEVSGEVWLRFRGVRPPTIMEDLAEGAAEALAKASIRIKKLDAFRDNGWSVHLLLRVEEKAVIGGSP